MTEEESGFGSGKNLSARSDENHLCLGFLSLRR